MMKAAKYLTFLLIIISQNLGLGKTLQGYIKDAEDHQKSSNLAHAALIMEEAVKAYPDSALTYAYLGLYYGMQAGQTTDFMEAGRLSSLSFEMLNKGIALDSFNLRVRFYRGLMGVNMPEFLGKLPQGIKDLEFVTKLHEKFPQIVPLDITVSAYDLLANGYQKNGEPEKAKIAWEKIIAIAPETSQATNAAENIEKISETKQTPPIEQKEPAGATAAELQKRLEKEPNNAALLVELGKVYIDTENYDEAEKTLKRAISIDSTNVSAYEWLVFTLERKAAKGYDAHIYENTNAQANLAFEIIKVLDAAVALASNDLELRFMRGTAEVAMPFFVGKLDQGIEDLNIVINGASPDSLKAQALYQLGNAYQKKAMTCWIKVVSKYPDSEISQDVFEGMRPPITHVDLSKYKTPILVIDFILGFRDELAPQTAVWIEDESGKFVKTIYVSGFSGYAKEKQINLPNWAASSKFADVDAVTSASIDLGHYVYVWDSRDNRGGKVKSGNYNVKVEVSYWPSMKYQLVSTPINIGKKDARAVVEQGNLIPYVEVKYLH